MRSCLVLLLALGLTSAAENTNKQLTVFGFPGGSPVWDPVVSSVLGLKSIYPVNAPISVNPLIPYNFYPLNVPNFVRNELPSASTNIRDLYNRPVWMILKSKSGVEGLTAYWLEFGLSSVADNPQTKPIYDAIRAGGEKSAVVINPNALYNFPAFRILKDLPVLAFEFPVGIKFANFANAMNSDAPFVFINDKEDSGIFDFEGLVRFGTFDISGGRVFCRSCY